MKEKKYHFFLLLGVGGGELKTLVHDGLDVHSGQNKFLKENVSFQKSYTRQEKPKPPLLFFKVER